MEAAASAAQPEPRAKARLVYPKLAIPFVLLILCFAAWGAAANLTDVLVGVFRSTFDMSNAQSALIQVAYYGAYFTLAIPAALINRRFQPKLDWDKGKAVLYLLAALDLEHDGVVPFYIGDDSTDEHTFEGAGRKGNRRLRRPRRRPGGGRPDDRRRLRARLDGGGGAIPGHARTLTVAYT